MSSRAILALVMASFFTGQRTAGRHRAKRRDADSRLRRAHLLPSIPITLSTPGGGTSASIKVRKSTDQGLTFGAPVTVATFVSLGGANGDLGLTGVLNGGGSVSIRSKNSRTLPSTR